MSELSEILRRVVHARQVRATATGFETVGDPITTPTLYLDTSDLSYLITGDVRRAGDRCALPWRERLTDLLHANRVRLRISWIHAAEIAVSGTLIESALAFVEHTPNIVLVSPGPHEIFKHELTQPDKALLIAESSQPLNVLRNLQFQLRFVPFAIPGRGISLVIKKAMQLQALGQRVRRRAGPSTERAAAVQDWLARHRLVRAWLHRRGMPEDFLESGGVWREATGMSWAATMRPDYLPRRKNHGWDPDHVVLMPATVLRSTIDRTFHNDRSRKPSDSMFYDAEHMAYVAYSDVSTIDKANLDATKGVRVHLPHLHVFGTGNLTPVLNAIERWKP